MNSETIAATFARLAADTRESILAIDRMNIGITLAALPESALEARMALSILALRLGVDVADFKGKPEGAPTVSRFHAKEES